jgi:hypothetical protein
MTAEMQARVAVVVEQQLTPALACVPQVCPKEEEPSNEAP